MHNAPKCSINIVRTVLGPCLAGFTGLHIIVRGKGGHGSKPDDTIDPIRPASEIYSRIYDYGVELRKKHKVVVMICKFQAGTSHNVVPNFVELQGSIRSLEP